ncbi:hypothetical protein [Teichococcus aestuarii]|uniref:hypothetical protein n=1 Tax=Teichococcus aestuarii TaxID=568898 RepID=UPI00361B0965
MPLLAPPDLFAALAIAAEADPDLPPGTHLRLLPSPALGFPLAPFGLFRVTAEPAEARIIWRDREHRPRENGELEPAEGVLFADIVRPAGQGGLAALVAVTVEAFEGTALLLDRMGDRILARASRPPYTLGGPRVERLRLEGRGQARLRLWQVRLSRVLEEMLGHGPAELLSLPVDGDRPWYAGGRGRDEALARVERAAPRRLGPPDQPDGPFETLPPQDEVLRVGTQAEAIVEACETMLRDPGISPRQAALPPAVSMLRGHRHAASVRIEGGLLLQAMDPGLGRFLGLLGHVGERSDPAPPAAYAAFGLFAADPGAPLPGLRTLGAALGAASAEDAALAGRLARLAVRTPRPEEALRQAEHTAARHGLEPRGLVAFAAAVPPPDPPGTPLPELGRAAWIGADGVSTAFRQDFVWPRPELGALVALGRKEADGWVSRHRSVALPAGAQFPSRALPLLPGRTAERPPQLPGGLLSDAPVPEADPPMRYRIATADLFGRFGPAVELDVPPPPRPPPPPAAPQLQVVPDGPQDGTAGKASPGHLLITVPVPAAAGLAAGTREIVAVTVALDGQAAASHPVPGPDTGAGRMLPLPPQALPDTAPGETARGTVRLGFLDAAGVASPETTLPYSCTDRRHPPVVPAAAGLIWTSRPGPAEEVELKLAWPAAPGALYRAFIADAKSLGLPGSSRAAIAVAASDRDRQGQLGGRSSFRLLTDPPLAAGPDGRAVLDTRLPRSFSAVQLLRIVPLGPAGQEAPFESCPVVAVAVPAERRPPPPRLTVRVDPATGRATLRVEAPGLDLVALQASEPGLFDTPPAAGARAPELRLRRAAGPVADPVYARIVDERPLGLEQGPDGPFLAAEFPDPAPLLPFVRYAYWAEVRMPAERRLPRERTDLPPAAGIAPLSPAQIADMPAAYSPVSAPAAALHAPAAPEPPDGLQVSVLAQPGGHSLALTVPSPPAAHPLAVGRYALRIWQRWGDGPIEPAGPDVELDGSPLQWTGPARPGPVAAPATLFVAVIDPLGRMAEPVSVTAPV